MRCFLHEKRKRELLISLRLAATTAAAGRQATEMMAIKETQTSALGAINIGTGLEFKK